ncbi:GNAT family N-acetyltransferase [Clostridiaceae bacterium]|nr:GNAT family N-acetyltransferase [Clostridiaceae bacterium]
MTNKEKYAHFCEKNFVPIYSKSWWLDAICGAENWDVWICENGGNIIAAMPYYVELRGQYKYITKVPLTQNNGIIFSHNSEGKPTSIAIQEEKIIFEVCEFISSLKLDVYEQQFQTSFTNWLPFMWNGYSAITRYTYIIEDTSNLNDVWNNITSKRRSVIKKGQRNSIYSTDLSAEQFYEEHEKIYKKQGLLCPFSYDLWSRLKIACMAHDSGKISCRLTEDGNIAAVSFVVWDERSLYKIMGGTIPEYSKLDAYSALTWDEIELAHKLGIKYDFEGSVIKRISKSFREYGAEPMPYFRIRKVFNPDIIREEAEYSIGRLKSIGE